MPERTEVDHAMNTDAPRSTATERPLLSFVLFSYNNMPYITEALRAAFAQTYEPLQIVVTDDCSTDGSYEAIKAAIEAYTGPHEVILNRNPQNLGLAGNLNRAAQLAASSVLVLAAGDDISDPRRVELVAEEFAKDSSVRAVVSSYTTIDEHGNETGEVTLPKDFDQLCRLDSVAKDGGLLSLGASFSYHREVLTTPRPIPEVIICEDCFLPMRALIMGRVAFIRASLVRYRKHGASSTAEGSFKLPQNIAAHQQALLEDLHASREHGLIDERLYRRIRRKIVRYPPHVRRLLKLQKSPLAARAYGIVYHNERTLRRLYHRLLQRPT